MVGAGGSCTHGTFLHPPCCHTRRPWGDPVGAQQAAAPLGDVSRSAGSLWGQSEPTGFNAYDGGRWQLYTWNLSPPTLLPHQAAWGDPVGAQQAAAPLGDVSRSAGSLWGQSEPTGINAYDGGRWQLYTWNLSPPTPKSLNFFHDFHLFRLCAGYLRQ
jgi:hypothetical protein